MEFDKLLTQISERPEVFDAIQDLLEKKRNASELGVASAVPVLNDFIEDELMRAIAEVPGKSHDPEVVGVLNRMLHGVLREYGADGPMHRA